MDVLFGVCLNLVQLICTGQYMLLHSQLYAGTFVLNVDGTNVSYGEVWRNMPFVHRWGGFMLDRPDRIILREDVKTFNSSFSTSKAFSSAFIDYYGLETKLLKRLNSSRRFPLSLTPSMKIKHLRSVLLHGPPGIGMTSFVKYILPLKITGAKFYYADGVLPTSGGKSNIDLAFQTAQQYEQDEATKHFLHVLVIDGIEMITSQKIKMDESDNSYRVLFTGFQRVLQHLKGVESPGAANVIVVGLTNRRDLINEFWKFDLEVNMVWLLNFLILF
jgi:hypothetical protein